MAGGSASRRDDAVESAAAADAAAAMEDDHLCSPSDCNGRELDITVTQATHDVNAEKPSS